MGDVNSIVCHGGSYRSSCPEVFLDEGILRLCSKLMLNTFVLNQESGQIFFASSKRCNFESPETSMRDEKITTLKYNSIIK